MYLLLKIRPQGEEGHQILCTLLSCITLQISRNLLR